MIVIPHYCQMHKRNEILRVEYRNGTYYGQVNKNKARDGYGILLFDNSEILLCNGLNDLGEWKDDYISGSYVFFGSRLRAYGSMRNNNLEGFNAISSAVSYLQRNQQKSKSMYANFKNNKIYGNSVILEDGQVWIGQFINGEMENMFQKNNMTKNQPQQTLRKMFPNNTFEFTHFLKAMHSEAIQNHRNSEETTKFRPALINYEDNCLFYGFEEPYRNRRFGFIFRDHEILTSGEYQNDQLEGLGHTFRSNGIIEDGVFQDGALKGIGVRYEKNSNKFRYGDFKQQSEMGKGYNYPQHLISQYRHEFHLRSLYFRNDKIILGLEKKFQNPLNSFTSLKQYQRNNSNLTDNLSNFSSRGELGANRGRNFTVAEKYQGSPFNRPKSKQKQPNPNDSFQSIKLLDRYRNNSTIEESAHEYQENHESNKVNNLLIYPKQDQFRNRNRSWVFREDRK